MNIYDIVMIIFGAGAFWCLFIEPAIESRENQTMRKKDVKLEQRRKELELEKEEFKMLFEMKEKKE